MSLNQTGRLVRMTGGPLGANEVAVTGFSGREAISRLFHFQLEFISTRLDLRPSDIIGKDISIELDRRDNHGEALPPRHFHGYVNRFAAGSVVSRDSAPHKYRLYRVELVPWLWFLTRTARCYLFFPEKEDKSIYEVIEAVFARAKSDLHIDPANDLKGISDLKKRKVRHCVQYRESDFNFVSRTMERYGVFYYFRFEEGRHTLVLDMKKNYPACAEGKVVYPGVTHTQMTQDHITSWEHDYEFVSGKWTCTDYNFEKPSTSLLADAPRLPSIELQHNDKYEIYDYPGDYLVKGDGEADARVRQEEEEVPHNLVNGASTCRTFTAGHKFKLEAYPDEEAASEAGTSWLLTAVEHFASQPGDDTSDTSQTEYCNRFTCIPDSVQFRPERVTPVPVVSGVQTAVVVGPPGETIHVDKYGRIKVQFHWDREGKKDGNTSCWIRVSQNWGGHNWGGVFLPHVGQEVIVDFLEGDPDQPIVIGRVYNSEQTIPLDLPPQKTKSIIRDHGGNEIRMEGEAGREQIRLHSPYANSTVTIGAPHSPGDGIHMFTDAFCNLIVGKDQYISIGGSNTVHITGDESQTIQGNEYYVIDGSEHQNIVGLYSKLIGGIKQETVVGAEVKTNVINKTELIGGWTIKAHKGKSYKSGPDDIELLKNKRIRKAEETINKEIKLVEMITGICDQKITTVNQKFKSLKAQVDEMHCRVGYLQHQITNAYKLIAGKLDFESKGGFDLRAGGWIDIDAAGTHFHSGDVLIHEELRVGGRVFVVNS